MEIERKFLVKLDRVPENLSGQTYIRQGYVPTGLGYSVRIRLLGPHKTLIMSSELTVKKNLTERTRYEFTLPMMQIDQARQLYDLITDKLEKIRYPVPCGKHIWDLDVFQGRHEGLVLAEVELASEDEVFERPEWLGEEVTGKFEYLNQNLAQKVF